MLIIICVCHYGDILIGMWDLYYIFVSVHFFLQENVGLKIKLQSNIYNCGCYNLWQRSQNIFFKSCYLLWTILLCFNSYAHISFTVLNKLCLIPLSSFLRCFKPDLLLQTTFPLPTLRAACGVVDVCVPFFFFTGLWIADYRVCVFHHEDWSVVM